MDKPWNQKNLHICCLSYPPKKQEFQTNFRLQHPHKYPGIARVKVLAFPPWCVVICWAEQGTPTDVRTDLSEGGTEQGQMSELTEP